MNNLFLTTNQQSFERYQNQMIEFGEVYTNASKELVNLDVKGYKAENLINGGFLALFHDHHKNEHAQQPQWANLGIRYEKYLDLKEFDTTKLEALEAEHERIIELKFELYETNDNFFSFAENRTRDTSYQKALTFAPEKLTYKVFDFLSFKGNTAKINIPKKPFEIHALNKSQIDLLQDVRNYVDSCRKLGLKYSDVLKNVEKYVKWENGRSTGLSFDLKQIEFSYNQILNQRLL
ncbi:hypothetical protein [Psychroflexus lacisalsi]|uniref:Uncharacterized protein n=1 Tax=Psychroflexus lacisalsi TaxID=503928 RepID=A0ABP3VMX0_9FLAO|nr:hypothetical protein [Psychroflexus lacisalsi]MBZ9620469.1 hypothetical protein [Psychroflexus lacisalsi]